MTPFQDVSLRVKIRVIITASISAALGLVCAAYLVYDTYTFRHAAADRLEVLANTIGNHGSLATAGEQRQDLKELLTFLSSERNVLAAAIYGKEGPFLAEYHRGTPPSISFPDRPGSAGSAFEGPADLVITTPIVDKAEQVGMVYLRSDLPEARTRLRTNIAIVLFIFALTTGAAFLLSAKLARVVTGPVVHLAEIVNRVTVQRDYTARAEKHGQDELGVLIDGFNDMLAQVQVRDGALQLARNELEMRVEERTAQLQFVNEEMKTEVAERKRAEESMRESEERYRQLVELSPDAIVIHADGKLVYVNSAATALFGAKSPVEIVGRPILDFVPPEVRDDEASRILKIQDGNEQAALYEEKLVRLDGSQVDIEVASISFVYQGRPASQVIIRDITTRKEVERMKNEFVSTVSHELRTPITSIQGSLGLIANGVLGALPPAAKPLIDIAHKNCQRLVLLINDILDMEKIAAGKMKFTFKPVDVLQLVEQTIESNRAYGAQFGVAFALLDDAPGARVNVDSDRLIQVFTNLLSNAAKFSPKGETVTVTVSRKGGWVRVAVSDRGPGIPEEFKRRIFQKFSQADSSDMRQKGGTGLGLAICKTIVDKHGGRVSFETEAGRGTTFFVDLPFVAEATADVQPAKPAAPHILICEDDAQIAAFIRLVLSHEGCRSDIAGDTAQARRMLKEKKYDAMTLDVMLPDRDGLAFLEELRTQESTRALPVIIISAVASSHAETLMSGRLHVVDCLDKPIDQGRLLSALRLAIRGRAAGRARVLHVEGEADVRQLVAYTLRNVAETSGASGLAEARKTLEKEAFDLVILNVELPDGSGNDLVPLLDRPGMARVPVVFFNARKSEARATHMLASTLVKSLAAQPDLPESIQSWVSNGRSEKMQGAKP
ncbi:MAG TPA: ATP-binding protein [Planctomycetota bacterium]|nr:ATP-binding protein [Planctomycetota bacterium]